MPISRRLLEKNALTLSDEEYVRTVAGLGARRLTWDSMAFGPQHSLEWRVKRLQGRQGPASWASARRSWQKVQSETDGRLLIDDGPHPEEIDLKQIARTLSHPSSGAKAVYVKRNLARADLRWQWPFRLAAFERDFKALRLDVLKEVWPSSALTRPQVVSRDAPRAELLVICGDAGKALLQLAELQYQVRATFLVLVAPMAAPWRRLRAPIEALLEQTQAAGVLLLQPRGGPALRTFLDRWFEQMSHDVAFDLALSSSLSPAESMLLLDTRLIDAAALLTSARKHDRRVRALPPGAVPRAAIPLRRRAKRRSMAGAPPSFRGAMLESAVTSGALEFLHESDAQVVADANVAARQAALDVATREPARYLQGDLFLESERRRLLSVPGLVARRKYTLELFVAPPKPGAIVGDVPFPDEQLSWHDPDEWLTLQVIFAEPEQLKEPLCGSLKLPRTGKSTICSFSFSPIRRGPFRGRVTLYHRGRVLQTAVLQTRVLGAADLPRTASNDTEKLSFRVEAKLRRSMSTLSERRPFDAFLLCNHTTAHRAAITAAGKDGAYIASLGNTGATIAAINALLTQPAMQARPYAKGLASKAGTQLLVDLATEGAALYGNIVVDYLERSPSAQAIRKAEYLQVVTMDPEAIVPLEFVYEYPAPAHGARVCPNALRALSSGRCPVKCRPKSSEPKHVCPMGFWGLSKVIERHIHVPDLLQKPAKVLATEPLDGRDELSLDRGTLSATSEQVNAKDGSVLDTALRRLWGKKVARASSWKGWQQKIRTSKPGVLVMLPHAAGSQASITLEIGGDTKASRHIDQTYVHAPGVAPPIAVLFGCDTANTISPDAYLSHVAMFRRGDAALVLGTVATVLGADAAKMTRHLLAHLKRASDHRQVRFGELLRDAKRAAVKDGLIMAMCLVSFGDADWFLTRSK